MDRARYDDGSTVPTGFLNTGSAIVLAAAGVSSAFLADVTVRVTPTVGDAWVAISTNPTAVADTAGNHIITQAQDFNIKKGDKISSTAIIQITPFK